jgi:hypothetical protein
MVLLGFCYLSDGCSSSTLSDIFVSLVFVISKAKYIAPGGWDVQIEIHLVF